MIFILLKIYGTSKKSLPNYKKLFKQVISILVMDFFCQHSGQYIHTYIPTYICLRVSVV